MDILMDFFVPRMVLLWCGRLDITQIHPLPCKNPFPKGWCRGSPKIHVDTGSSKG